MSPKNGRYEQRSLHGCWRSGARGLGWVWRGSNIDTPDGVKVRGTPARSADMALGVASASQTPQCLTSLSSVSSASLNVEKLAYTMTIGDIRGTLNRLFLRSANPVQVSFDDKSHLRKPSRADLRPRVPNRQEVFRWKSPPLTVPRSQAVDYLSSFDVVLRKYLPG